MTAAVGRIASALALLLAFGTPAAASGDVASTSPRSTLPEGWRVEFVPYLWLSSVHGTSSVGGRSMDVDVGYDEVFDLMGDHLSLLAGFAHLEIGHERTFGFLDVAGTTLDTDASARLTGISAPELGVSTTRIDAAANVRLDSVVFEFGGGYRLLESRLPARAQPFYVEAIAGGRYNYFWTRVRATASTRILGLPEGSKAIQRAVTGGGDVDWVDPFVGGRFGVPLTDALTFTFRGDIGGFGAGADLAWSIASGLRYALPWEPVAGVHPWLGIGYKILSVDYESGPLRMDITYQGPATALGLSF